MCKMNETNYLSYEVYDIIFVKEDRSFSVDTMDISIIAEILDICSKISVNIGHYPQETWEMTANHTM